LLIIHQNEEDLAGGFIFLARAAEKFCGDTRNRLARSVSAFGALWECAASTGNQKINGKIIFIP
jgi:hypothetical protein